MTTTRRRRRRRRRRRLRRPAAAAALPFAWWPEALPPPPPPPCSRRTRASSLRGGPILYGGPRKVSLLLVILVVLVRFAACAPRRHRRASPGSWRIRTPHPVRRLPEPARQCLPIPCSNHVVSGVRLAITAVQPPKQMGTPTTPVGGFLTTFNGEHSLSLDEVVFVSPYHPLFLGTS